MNRRRALGSGLGGLIAADVQTPASGLREIPAAAIVANPYQPRTTFDTDAIEELAHSIREHGLLQPLVVTELPSGDYQLIAGERRWRAARRAGLVTIPAVVKEASPQQQLELALIENIQRADLGAIEEARAYRALADDFGLTHEQIAERIGKSRSLVTQMLGLLRLPADVQELVMNGVLSLGHVRPLLTLKNDDEQSQAAHLIAERGMNARQAEALVTQWRDRQPSDGAEPAHSPIDPNDASAIEQLQNVLGVRIQLRRSGTGGRIMLFWDNEEMLDMLYQRLIAS